jgi:hypothetical protein
MTALANPQQLPQPQFRFFPTTFAAYSFIVTFSKPSVLVNLYLYTTSTCNSHNYSSSLLWQSQPLPLCATPSLEARASSLTENSLLQSKRTPWMFYPAHPMTCLYLRTAADLGRALTILLGSNGNSTMICPRGNTLTIYPRGRCSLVARGIEFNQISAGLNAGCTAEWSRNHLSRPEPPP